MIEQRFIKFLFVGALNTVFGYSVYAILLMIGAHYSLAALVATVLGVLFNFKTTGKLVFNNSDNSLLIRFIATYTATYIINIMLLKLFKLINFNMYIAGAILILPMALVSYVLLKNFVFDQKGKNDENTENS